MKLSEVKQILESTAVDLGPKGKDKDYGSGRIDAYKELERNNLRNAFFNSKEIMEQRVKSFKYSVKIESSYFAAGTKAVFGKQNLIADFTATPTIGNAPLTVLFTDTSTGRAPTSWYWDFGDRTNSKNPRKATHTFTKPGTYTVTLRSWNEIT